MKIFSRVSAVKLPHAGTLVPRGRIKKLSLDLSR